MQESVFDSMTYKQWSRAIKSKVNTSWNLHKLLLDLDFFLLLSSMSSYAAGCTFQDALSYHRNVHGQNTISLDIGWMRAIGIISRRPDYQRNRVNARDMIPIEEGELLSLLDLCCDPRHKFHQTPPAARSQILMGATTPAFFLQRGDKVVPTICPRLFSGLTGTLEASAKSKARSADQHIELFKQAQTPAMKAQIVSNTLMAKLARALSVSADHIDPGKTLSDFGVDSLMAIELRNWAINDFQAKVAVFEIMGISITKIGELIVSRSI
jgi:hypothetical protein